jgi:hypothetical protein
MEIGNIIKIRNSSGLLTIILDKKLNRGDVCRCMGEDKLGAFNFCRWEFHKGKYGEIISTLHDEVKDNHKMFVAIIDAYDVEVWAAHFDESEEDETIFETLT